jgi:hypothetical protein
MRFSLQPASFVCFTGFTIVLCLSLGCERARAQSTTPKIELGPQFTSLTLLPTDPLGGSVSEAGLGGRVTYNFTDHLAAEAEINLYPNRNVFGGIGEGRALQGQFGLKAGKRFRKFGLFAKARPGFLSFGRVFSYEPGTTLALFNFTIPNARIGRKTHLTTDVGAVLELYPSRRTVVRFDVGDTLIRYGSSFQALNFDPSNLVRRPAETSHNLQLTAGVAFRFHTAEQDEPATPKVSSKGVPKYEVGVQFTSLSRNPPKPICSDICLFGSTDFGPVTEPGFGGRFTYNLTSYIGVEAEANFLPRDNLNFFGPGGRLFQGQFGAKAGKRFQRFGFFAKARPGFITFTNAKRLVGTRTQIFPGFDNRVVTFGIFRIGKKAYFSTDVGGVVEFYPSRRVMTRFDLGDTIIRYSEYAVEGFSLSNPIVRRPAERRHNFQFTAGVGFRF